MAEGNNDLIIEMIDIFAAQAVEMWNEMQVLYDKDEYDLLGKLAHKAKSSVAIMGMESLADKLKELELYCMTGEKKEEYQELINFFKSDCQFAIDELQEYKKNLIMQKK